MAISEIRLIIREDIPVSSRLNIGLTKDYHPHVDILAKLTCIRYRETFIPGQTRYIRQVSYRA